VGVWVLGTGCQHENHRVVEMALARVRFLDEDEENLVHEMSLQCLEEIGVLVRSSEVLKLLEDAGASVNMKTGIVKIPECLVCEALSLAPLDMKSGSFVTGPPEYGVLGIAGSEMAKFYGLPSMMSGYGSSAKFPGVQAGLEKGITTVAVALSGCDLLTGIGGLNDAAFVSMEELLIDAQIWEDIKRTWWGMDFNDSDFALNVIEKVGPKGQYLSHPHTFANFRKLHISKYSDRSSYTAWEAAGKKDMTDTVKAEVRKILESHKPAPLDKVVRQKLAEIEKKASKIAK